jgi:hypothetical protein
MDAGVLLNYILVIGVIVAGTGYALGQFFSARRRGMGDSLDVAMHEIEALRVRDERRRVEVEELRSEVGMLRAENDSFRSLLTGGTFLADQFRVLIAEEIERGVDAGVAKVIAALRDGGP